MASAFLAANPGLTSLRRLALSLSIRNTTRILRKADAAGAGKVTKMPEFRTNKAGDPYPIGDEKIPLSKVLEEPVEEPARPSRRNCSMCGDLTENYVNDPDSGEAIPVCHPCWQRI